MPFSLLFDFTLAKVIVHLWAAACNFVSVGKKLYIVVMSIYFQLKHMKNTLPCLASLFLLFISFTSWSQDDKRMQALSTTPELRVEQRQVSWVRNDYTAHTIYIVGDAKAIEQQFEKLLKSKYKMKFSNTRGWRETQNVLMADIIAESANVAFSTEDEREGTRLRMIVDLGGNSLNALQYPVAVNNLENLLIGFAREFYSSAYNEAIEDEKKLLKNEEKALAELEKTEKKLKKENEKAAKSVEKMEKEMEKLRRTISENERTLSKDEKTREEKRAQVKARTELLDRLRQAADGVRR